MSARPRVQHFYHESSGTLTYVVSDPATSCAAIVDPVLGFDAVSGRTDTVAADEVVTFVRAHNLDVQWLLETHAHADHLSAAQYLKASLGGEIGIGEGICDVQAHFGPVFNLGPPFAPDGHQFDRLFRDGESFGIGDIECRVLHTPGHTSDSVTYVVGGYAFIGDTLFNVDAGTARCDFPGGDAARLFDSIQKLLALPGDTLLCLCHDYPPEGRELRSSVTVREQAESNIHVGGGRSRQEFVEVRVARDRTLSLPALILPSIQVNIGAGHLPAPESNAIAYLKIPLDTF